MNTRQRRRTLLTLGLVSLLLATGCTYSRVVGAKGFGSERVQVEEPYQESSQIDRWFYGDDPVDKQRARQSN